MSKLMLLCLGFRKTESVASKFSESLDCGHSLCGGSNVYHNLCFDKKVCKRNIRIFI